MTCLSKVFSGLLFASLLSGYASAATYTWDGTANNWNSPHWNPGPVAFPGAGHAMVVNGGTVYVTDAQASYFPASITVANGGTLKIFPSGRLFSGADATTQTLNVSAGGTLELDTWFRSDTQSLGRLAADAARLVVNGGTIRMTGVTGYGRGVTVNAGGATLEAALGADWLINQVTDDVPWIYNGNPTLIFTGAGVGRFEKAITGGSSVIKRGSGLWTLARSSSYTGSTTVEAGVLALRRASLGDASTISISNGAVLSLRHVDTDVIGTLILNGVTMPAGTYNRSTHPNYFSGSGSLTVGGAAVTGTPTLTWINGGGGDPGINQQVTDAMNYAVSMHNQYGVFYGDIYASYVEGVPTAEANFGGPIRFGGSRSGRVALHEFGHVWGGGTINEWYAQFVNGVWAGPNVVKLMTQIDGPGAGIYPSGQHFYPYGLNYDNESSPRNDIVSVRVYEAMRKDIGSFNGASTISAIGDRTIVPGGNSGAIPFTVGDPSTPAASLVPHAISSNPALIPASGFVFGGSGANRTLTVTPATGITGSALITVNVSGGRDAVITSFIVYVGSYQWTGGSGAWDLVAAKWNDGQNTWPTLGNNNDAVFGGTPGTVTVQERLNVDDLTFNTSGYTVNGGTLLFSNTPAIIVPDGISAIFGATIEGTPILTKDGAGTLTLIGANAYAGGVAVNAGTLIVDGDYSGSGAFTVRTGATLAGAGRLPAVTVESGGTLSPGPIVGTVGTKDLTINSGGALALDLGLASDRVVVSGNLNINGVLNLRLTDRPLNGYHTLINYTGTRTGTFTLGTVPAGYFVAVDYSVAGQVRLLVATGGLENSALVASGAAWKYNASGTNFGTAWRRIDYDDSNATLWPSGATQVGYGEGDEATAINVAAGKPQIVYLRKSFTLTASQIAGMSNLILALLRDDAAVVYLNGLEIRRDNFPAAPAVIAYNTPASSQALDEDESEYFVSTVDPSYLNVGLNVLAVEVHQFDAASSDLSFDLRLTAISGDPDTDDDGLLDAWEMRWFTTLAAQSGGDDAEADGASNFTEMRARTSPLERTQTFAIANATRNASGQMTITWSSVAGVSYQIHRTDSLPAWTALPGTIIGDGSLKSYTDTDPLPAGGTQMFYQVVVP